MGFAAPANLLEVIVMTITATKRPALNARDTLLEAVQRVLTTRWRGMRTAYHMAELASVAMEAFASAAKASPSKMTVGGLKPEHVASAVNVWLSRGLKASTINKMLICAGVCGAPVKGQFLVNRTQSKWWLTPETKAKAVAYCRADGRPEYLLLIDYIDWTTTTGLRVEETLRLKVQHLTGWGTGSMSVSIPGLKTSKAQATLPLTPEAASVANRRATAATPANTPLFPITYPALKRLWATVRDHVGEKGNPTATLKSLRRSAARHLHVDKGLPLDMVRQYLRHSDISTTMEYLRLVGGYSEVEMRRYLGGGLDESPKVD